MSVRNDLSRTFRRLGAAALALQLFAVPYATAQTAPPAATPAPPTELRVISFGGAANLPVWAAQREGYFSQEGLEVHLTFTPNSIYQMTQTYAGKYDIALTALDNVIAYQEGQADVKIEPRPDFVAFAATDNAFLTLVSQKSFKTVESLRGQTLTVDAMSTGFAFLLRDILAQHGIGDGDVKFISTGGTPFRLQAMLKDPSQAATIQNTPFEFIGDARGLNTIMRIEDAIGPYQGFVTTARRAWISAHERETIGFTRALSRSIDWLYKAENRPIAEAMLVANVPGMSPALAKQTYDVVLGANGGFFRTLQPNDKGVAFVLALRSKYGVPHKDLKDAAQYFDLSYLARARADAKP